MKADIDEKPVKKTKKELADEKREAIKREKTLHNKRVKTINRQIYILGSIFVAAFFAMAIYVGFYIEVKSKATINNSYNKRSDVLEKTVHRGTIYANDAKEVLAYTKENEDGTYERVYPMKSLFCHVVGSYEKGKTGLELSENYTLLEYDENLSSILQSDLTGKKIAGNSIVTTLDTELTKVCYDALGDQVGAVVVSNPKTGEILAMVSKPDYDPNTVAENWDEITNADTSQLINRVTQGLYAPGSTFKVVTMLNYLRAYGLDYSDYQYTCKGSDEFGGARINCYHGERHGNVGMDASITHSCNCSFANMGIKVSGAQFQNTANDFLFNKPLSIKDFNISTSKFTLEEDASEYDKIQAAIGQGTTLVTPLENLMIISAIANGGKIMTPYIVDRVIDSKSEIVKKFEPTVLTEAMTKDEADTISELLKGVCKTGTAKELSSLSYECSGKTGSAEFAGSDSSHAWFIGYAPSNDPQIAVSIIVEGAGTGSKFAVPIAKKIFESYLGK